MWCFVPISKSMAAQKSIINEPRARIPRTVDAGPKDETIYSRAAVGVARKRALIATIHEC